MDTGDQNMTLDDFLHWNVDALGSYLSKRGLSKDGTKQELAALCFAASKMNIPIAPTESEIKYINQQQYQSLLKVDNITLPDPLHLYSDWFDEKSGIGKWPPIFITDITSFLLSHEPEGEVKRHLNEYKIGKAYEYFSSSWLKEVFYHNIQANSAYCFLRARCTPSQRLRNEDHMAWICVRKDCGEIKSAYCTCTAGLGGTCNHVAGLLYRIEAANKMGITSCTAVPCSWNVPQDKTNPEPTQIKNLVVKKSKHNRPVKSRLLVGPNKKDFQPLKDQPADAEILQMFASELKDSLPNACFLKGIENVPTASNESSSDDNINQTVHVPESSNNVNIEQFCVSDLVCQARAETGSSEADIIVKNLHRLSADDVSKLSQVTCGQFNNQYWFRLRDGRITSSNFYAVYTKVRSFKADPNVNVKNLLSIVMGYVKPSHNIKSLKHGRETEPLAKIDYIKEFSKKHADVQYSECGIFIDINYPFLATSPDLIVSCKCCGNGLLEVKCCLIPQCTKCKVFCKCKLPNFLHTIDGKIQLKKTHAYYAQIQGQLSITGRSWCDLYVHTCNGSFSQRFVLDETYILEIFNHANYFFTSFVVPEIISRDLERELQEEPMQVDVPVQHGEGSVFFCPMCSKKVKEIESAGYTHRDQSIACDRCHLWYHFTCVKMTKAKAQQIQSWTCPKCL